jgi:hypothetical protein
MHLDLVGDDGPACSEPPRYGVTQTGWILPLCVRHAALHRRIWAELYTLGHYTMATLAGEETIIVEYVYANGTDRIPTTVRQVDADRIRERASRTHAKRIAIRADRDVGGRRYGASFAIVAANVNTLSVRHAVDTVLRKLGRACGGHEASGSVALDSP